MIRNNERDKLDDLYNPINILIIKKSLFNKV